MPTGAGDPSETTLDHATLRRPPVKPQGTYSELSRRAAARTMQRAMYCDACSAVRKESASALSHLANRAEVRFTILGAIVSRIRIAIGTSIRLRSPRGWRGYFGWIPEIRVAVRSPVLRPRDYHIGFPDPAKATGTEARKMAMFRRVRDSIQKRLREDYDSELRGKLLMRRSPAHVDRHCVRLRWMRHSTFIVGKRRKDDRAGTHPNVTAPGLMTGSSHTTKDARRSRDSDEWTLDGRGPSSMASACAFGASQHGGRPPTLAGMVEAHANRWFSARLLATAME